jgi:hypothetical protein
VRPGSGSESPKPGAADHDVADPELGGDGVECVAAALRRADRAVQVQHEQAVARAGLQIAESPAIAQRHGLAIDWSRHGNAC